MSTDVLEKAPKLLKALQEVFDEINSHEDYPPLVIKITDVTETDWVKEGTEGAGQIPERMAFPGLYRIKPDCSVALYDKQTEYKLATIRYIAGCPSLDPKWQDQNGYKPDIGQDNIWIVNGTETFTRVGAEAAKYDYIKLYQGNINNPYRPPTADNEIEEVIEKDVAESLNKSFDERLEAMKIVGELRIKTSKGFNYDTERLQVLSTIFNLGGLPTNEEKFQELAFMAENDPDKIINSIIDSKKGIYASVKKALDLGVISLDDERASFVENNAVILPFKTKMDQVGKINKLVDYLLTETGDIIMQQIAIKSQAAAELLLSQKN